jgi:dynein heavy chain
MTYETLGGIYKGLAASGTWGCFDEFNRLIPEVLSVCAFQFGAVCDAIKENAATVEVEGETLALDPTCGAFITMNPGYLGRSELPEKLKALFRPITVMVPDLVLICENFLMAEGFVEAKDLALKFFTLYNLSKSLLSPAMHYDWGLRAIKTVLVVAGAFKRAEPEVTEANMLMRVLRDINMPKLSPDDRSIFTGLLNDLFPGLNPPVKIDEAMYEYARQAVTEKMGLYPEDAFLQKVLQLSDILVIRHCVFVMGNPGSFKSTCWKCCAEAQTIKGEPTKIIDINPKSISASEF